MAFCEVCISVTIPFNVVLLERSGAVSGSTLGVISFAITYRKRSPAIAITNAIFSSWGWFIDVFASQGLYSLVLLVWYDSRKSSPN